MHCEIHCDKPTGRRRVLGKCIPGIDENSGVMIPMEKDKRLLAKYNEYGVTKFGHFGQDEHCGPESGHFIVLDITGDANGVIEAVVAKYVEEFGQCAASANNAERGQQDVPANERSTKLVTRSVGHKLLSSKNDQHVDTDVVEAGRPVAVEPHFGVGVLKIIFELEDV